MVEATPDIYAILEAFLKENFSSKYSPEEMTELVRRAKEMIRERGEKNLRRKEGPEESTGPMPRRPTYDSQAGIEDKLLESLKRSIDREDREDSE
jgi:hypothetical protein